MPDFEPRRSIGRTGVSIARRQTGGTHGAIGEDILVENELLRKDVVQIPFERVTVQTRANTSTAFHVTKIFALGRTNEAILTDVDRYLEIVPMHVVEALVIVHPDFGETHRISTVNITFA